MSNSEYLPSANEHRDLRKGKRPRSQTDARAASAVDRLPPHSIEAEQGVLGCIFLNSEEAMSALEEGSVREDWFYDLRHQVIWMCVATLYDEGRAVDIITAQTWLKDRNQLESCGGIAYLAGLPDTVPSAHNLPNYLSILREKKIRRKIVRDCADIIAQVYDSPTETLSELIDEHTKNALALSEETTGHAEKPVRELILENINRFENDYHRGSAQITGLTTGLSYLDKVTGGLGGENGNFIVPASRPGLGKTSIALDFTTHIALKHVWFKALSREEFLKVNGNSHGASLADGALLPEGFIWARDNSVIFQKQQGVPCCFFSLEMSGLRLVRRMLFQHSGADLQLFRTGFAKAEDFTKLGRSASALGKAPIWVDDTSELTVEILKARCRRMVRQYGIKMFCVDYLQIMPFAHTKFQRPDRVAETREISRQIRSLGKELNVPIFVLGQLNREVERGDRWRPPRMSDIADCDAIARDADVVMLLYRPKWASNETSDEHEAWLAQVAAVQPAGHDWSKRLRRIDVMVDKNRDGMTGNCQLVFDGAPTHFEDYGDWQKKHGLKAIAAGEARSKGPSDLPSNEEMGL